MQVIETKDATLVHEIMMDAFSEYADDPIPAGALNETLEQAEERLATIDRAYVLEDEGEALASVRFRQEDDYLYFYRLAVRRKARGKGYAKELIRVLEQEAEKLGLRAVRCNVRLMIASNIQLYKSLGYQEIQRREVERHGETIVLVTMEKEQ